MCFFGNNSPSPTPIAPITPLPAPVNPTAANADAQQARTDQAKKAQAAQGLASTVKTSPLGVTENPEIKKPTLY